jgi:glycosyltransferase involved in cell wall biosynthesis
MSQPTVSAITIFRDAEKYLDEAITGVRAQNCDDWELLLVDDGSRDRSSQIARRYAAEFSGKIHYLEHAGHENRGMSASRNLGIAHARGEFIAFIDADDVWLPEKLSEQVSLMRSHPEAAMVYGRTLIWHSWNGALESRQEDCFLDLGVAADQLIRPPALFYLLLQNKVQSPTTCNAMMRRAAILEVGGFEESFRGMYEDQVLFAKIELQFPVYVSGRCWAKYRQHPESSSAVPFTLENYCSTRLPFLTWLTAHLSARKIDRRAPIGRAVDSELWRCRHPAFFGLLEWYRRAEMRLRECIGRAGARRRLLRRT